MEQMNNKKRNWKATCGNCDFEWTIKEFKQKIACPECCEAEIIDIKENDED